MIPTTHPDLGNRLGDLPPEASALPATLDVGDRAHRVARAKPILRLHRTLVDVWPDSMPAKATAQSLLNDLDRRYEEDPDGIAGEMRDLLTELSTTDADLPDRYSWLPEAAKELGREFSNLGRLRRECHLVGAQTLILVGRRRVATLAQQADSFSDEDDGASSGTSHGDGRPVPLRAHLSGVETVARRDAVGCGLPEALTDAVARAGLLHDLGKADPRFQSMLRGGSPWPAGGLLAKSAEMPKSRAARERARGAAGYPRGGRHELLSVRLIESAPALLPDDADVRELVLHLIASHHGRCRPFAPVVIDDEPVGVDYEAGAAQRQVAMQDRRYADFIASYGCEVCTTVLLNSTSRCSLNSFANAAGIALKPSRSRAPWGRDRTAQWRYGCPQYRGYGLSPICGIQRRSEGCHGTRHLGQCQQRPHDVQAQGVFPDRPREQHGLVLPREPGCIELPITGRRRKQGECFDGEAVGAAHPWSVTRAQTATVDSPGKPPSAATSSGDAGTSWWTTSSVRAARWPICVAGSRNRAGLSSALSA